MSKYIPPEKMTITQIAEEITTEFNRWEYISLHGCSDPFWTDGINMNLIRNHIIYWYHILADRTMGTGQISIFDLEIIQNTIRPLPPEVPSRLMIRGGEHPDQYIIRENKDLEWYEAGEYRVGRLV